MPLEFFLSIDVCHPSFCMSNCATLFGCHLLSLLLAEHLSVIARVSELAFLSIKGDRRDHCDSVRVHRSINLHLVHIDVFHIFGHFAQLTNFLLILRVVGAVVAYFGR